MSKKVKQMQMDALRDTFGTTRDLVLLSISGLGAVAENQMRLALRKKNIRLHTVKNSLAARVFTELGIRGLDESMQGPTTVAWGGPSIADLSKEIDAWIQKNQKAIKAKAAVADGAVVTFDAAKRFPTREGAIARVVALALSPAARLVSMLTGPAATIAAQLKTLGEKSSSEAEPGAVGES